MLGLQAGLGKHRPLPSASSVSLVSPLTICKCGNHEGPLLGGTLVSLGVHMAFQTNPRRSWPLSLRTEAGREQRTEGE